MPGMDASTGAASAASSRSPSSPRAASTAESVPASGRALALVQTLSTEERHVLMLHYAEGLEPLEISLVLDLPVPTVERMLDDLRALVAREVRIAG